MTLNQAPKPVGKIRGLKIEDYVISQRLKYKLDVDIEDGNDLTVKADSDEGIYDDASEYSIQQSTQDAVYIKNKPTLELTQTTPYGLINNQQFFDPRSNTGDNDIIDPRALDLVIGANGMVPDGKDTGTPRVVALMTGQGTDSIDNGGMVNSAGAAEEQAQRGIRHIIRSGMVEETLSDATSFKIGGQNFDISSFGVGGIAAQGAGLYNQAASLTNGIFDTKLKTIGDPGGDEPLNQAIVPLEAEKENYTKSINLNYQNTKLYNRLENIANTAAGMSNLLAPQNFNLDINNANGIGGAIKDAFSGWKDNVFGSNPDFDITGEELVQLNTANYQTMSYSWNKPMISIKNTKMKNLSANSGLYFIPTDAGGDDNLKYGVSPTYPSVIKDIFSEAEIKERVEAWRTEQRSGLHFSPNLTERLSNTTGNYSTPQRTDNPEKNNKEVLGFYEYKMKMNSNLSTFLSNNKYRTVSASGTPNEQEGTIRRYIDKKGEAATTAKFIIQSEVDTLYTESSINLEKLKKRYDKLRHLGYLYVRPYPNSLNIEPYIIPFEFNIKTTETSISAKYATEEMLNRIGGLRTYINTEPSSITLETSYVALAEDFEDGANPGKGNNNFNITSWQFYWDLKKIREIETLYRSLPLLVNYNESSGPGIVKPPLIKIIMSNSVESVNNISNLYRYPHLNKQNNDINGGEYYFKNERIANGTDPRRKLVITYKSYLVQDVTISYDSDDYPMKVPASYKISVYPSASGTKLEYDEEKDSDYWEPRGFKVTMTLVEIQENYLDVIPDFFSYYTSIANLDEKDKSKANPQGINLDTRTGLNLKDIK